MFQQPNRENFNRWTAQLINGNPQNMTTIRELQWRNKLSISNFDQLKELQQSLNLTQEILISGLCYMKRLTGKGLKLTQTSIYKLAVTCLFIAQKFYSDYHYGIQDFSVGSGVIITDILTLQIVAIELLQYNLILTERDYFAVLLFGKV